MEMGGTLIQARRALRAETDQRQTDERTEGQEFRVEQERKRSHNYLIIRSGGRSDKPGLLGLPHTLLGYC